MSSNKKNNPEDSEENPTMHIDGSDELLADALKSVEGGQKKSETKDPKTEKSDFNQLKSLIEKKDALIKEAHDRYVRLAADFDNYKKRAAKERDVSVNREKEDLIRGFLEVVDNFERTLQVPEESLDIKTLLDGIQMIHRQTLHILDKMGVQTIESVGKPFDPRYHEAVSQEPTSKVPHNHVTRELERGYLIQDRLLRAAKVVVANNPNDSKNDPNSDKPQENEDSTSNDGSDIHIIKC